MLLLVILLKSNTFHGCFSRFLNRTNSTNSRKVSQIHRMSISSKIYSFLIESDPDSDSSSTPDGNYILKSDILFSCWALKWSNSVFVSEQVGYAISNSKQWWKTMQSPIPKKKIKPNWEIRMMFGEISNRHKEDITKEKNIE